MPPVLRPHTDQQHLLIKTSLQFPDPILKLRYGTKVNWLRIAKIGTNSSKQTRNSRSRNIRPAAWIEKIHQRQRKNDTKHVGITTSIRRAKRRGERVQLPKASSGRQRWSESGRKKTRQTYAGQTQKAEEKKSLSTGSSHLSLRSCKLFMWDL